MNSTSIAAVAPGTSERQRVEMFTEVVDASAALPRVRSSLVRGSEAPGEWKVGEGDTVVTVRNADCLAVVAELLEAGHTDVGLLNMASEKRPGGGVERGSVAQEEHLCRFTSLYSTLQGCRRAYALRSNEMVWSPQVWLMRDMRPPHRLIKGAARMPSFAVVSAAAPRRPDTTGDGKRYRYSEDFNAMRDKVTWLLREFAARGCRRLVLGAWGCGAFGNPAPAVAGILHTALTKNNEFKGVFDSVCFAIRTQRYLYCYHMERKWSKASLAYPFLAKFECAEALAAMEKDAADKQTKAAAAALTSLTTRVPVGMAPKQKKKHK